MWHRLQHQLQNTVLQDWNLWFWATSSHCQVLVSTVCKPWRRLTAKMYKICSFRHSNARPWQWKNCKPSHALLLLKSTIESYLLAMWCFRFWICLQCDQAAQHTGQARRLTRSSCHQNKLGHDPEWWCVLRGSQEPLATSLSSREIHPSAGFLWVNKPSSFSLCSWPVLQSVPISVEAMTSTIVAMIVCHCHILSILIILYVIVLWCINAFFDILCILLLFWLFWCFPMLR